MGLHVGYAQPVNHSWRTTDIAGTAIISEDELAQDLADAGLSCDPIIDMTKTTPSISRDTGKRNTPT